jgi:hypothetical protein
VYLRLYGLDPAVNRVSIKPDIAIVTHLNVDELFQRRCATLAHYVKRQTSAEAVLEPRSGNERSYCCQFRKRIFFQINVEGLGPHCLEEAGCVNLPNPTADREVDCHGFNIQEGRPSERFEVSADYWQLLQGPGFRQGPHIYQPATDTQVQPTKPGLTNKDIVKYLFEITKGRSIDHHINVS